MSAQTYNLPPMSREFAFIQTAHGRVLVGWGPFEKLPLRRPGAPAFYATDFFLDDPRPWLHPASVEELSIAELASRFDASAPDIEWTAPARETFSRLFRSAQDAMSGRVLEKVVPVVFEHGHNAGGDPWGHVLRELATLPDGLWAYGWSLGGRSCAGGTPEMLFRSWGRGYTTMALAGTRPIAHAPELLTDAKELREHRIVVDDIVRRLAPFGNVEVGASGVLRLPRIAHLATPVFFIENGEDKMTYGDLIRRLHPTAALGASPRGEAADRWLRAADDGVERRAFGAPFGFERDDGIRFAIVSIRNVEWAGREVRIGSGVGLLRESDLERELDELRHKREQVKSLLGLSAEVHA